MASLLKNAKDGRFVFWHRGGKRIMEMKKGFAAALKRAGMVDVQTDMGQNGPGRSTIKLVRDVPLAMGGV